MSEENKSGESNSLSIKDSAGNEKSYTPEDVETLLKTNSDLSEKIAGAEGFNKVLDKYGTDQETYLDNAEAAFGVMSELIDSGLIDEQGKVIGKGNAKDESSSEGSGDDDFFSSLGISSEGAGKGSVSQKKALDIISKVVETKLGGLTKQIEDLSSGQAGLYRSQLKSTVLGKYSSFSDNDVSKLFNKASANPGKDLWAHAEELSKAKGESLAKARKHYADEFGINLADFDANKLNEQDSRGGGTIAALKGKKFVFPQRAKRLGLTESVSPRAAMVAHLKAKNR